jgi:hypothetical protein
LQEEVKSADQIQGMLGTIKSIYLPSPEYREIKHTILSLPVSLVLNLSEEQAD